VDSQYKIVNIIEKGEYNTMKTTYIFLNKATNELIRKEGCNEYIARYTEPVVSAHCILYQAILESNDYIRTITYSTTGHWQEVLHIEHIKKGSNT
jgi:hypothetical protein